MCTESILRCVLNNEGEPIRPSGPAVGVHVVQAVTLLRRIRNLEADVCIEALSHIHLAAVPRRSFGTQSGSGYGENYFVCNIFR
jgi:hypothetical protein